MDYIDDTQQKTTDQKPKPKQPATKNEYYEEY
uniref:Uncharacterized protein n=1 Tax=viral metagenome TaxID=1070528 RepID=A0A6C0LPV1_9ZZZZ